MRLNNQKLIPAALILLFALTAAVSAQTVPPLPADNRVALRTVWPLAHNNRTTNDTLSTRISAIETTAAKLGVTIAAPTATAVAATVTPPIPSATPSIAPTATPGPTSAASPTPQNTPTALPTGLPQAGKPCPADFHDATTWHPAVDPKTKCWFGHEHGDPPPQWLLDFVANDASQHAPNMDHAGLSFNHVMNTSAVENTKKHSCMKGFWLANGKAAGPHVQISWIQRGYPDFEVYLIYHACANPPDRAARFHSMQIFAKDRTGAISYWRFWIDSGDPRYYLDGGSRVETKAFDIEPNNSRPILRVDWGADSICEQWYMFGTQPRWLPDIGVTICNTPTAYSDIERRISRGETKDADGAPLPDVYDQSWWPDTGARGGERNIEFVYYSDPVLLPFLDKTTVIDQFGSVISGGLLDARCGQLITKSGMTFTRLCTTMLIHQSLYQQMSETTTFSKGQIGPREQHRYDTTGVGIAN